MDCLFQIKRMNRTGERSEDLVMWRVIEAWSLKVLFKFITKQGTKTVSCNAVAADTKKKDRAVTVFLKKIQNNRKQFFRKFRGRK